MKLLLIRHGEMAGDPFATPARPVQGCLSARGIEQAQRLASALADIPITHVLSSSYGRALQTAEIALGGRDLPIDLCDFLQEWQPNRELEALPGTAFEEIVSQNATKFAEETWKTELGEGCYDIYARVIPPLLAKLHALGVHARHGAFVLDATARESTVALFAHGGSLNIVLSHLLRLPPFPVGACCFELTGMARISFTEMRGVWYPALDIPAPCGSLEGSGR